MPEAVAAPMGDDDTNFTKCGCPDHEYCPGAPPPNGHCGWLGAQGFACGNPAGAQKFDLRDGVIWSTVGYTSGTTPAPNYDDLGDHTEALRLEFDEAS
ncbi:peptide-methionine (S)-S-oxide reductase [Aureococcus anophagefferens]|uniref:peptide-methionine (S)-S-oxide reductase n=1 Tax=Aureococcus anophagefferens TaxID=44056 RepID=A0ABR1G421_AURAN